MLMGQLTNIIKKNIQYTEYFKNKFVVINFSPNFF